MGTRGPPEVDLTLLFPEKVFTDAGADILLPFISAKK
jgi:hypothetical protein